MVQTTYALWYGNAYHFSDLPLLPFGCRVMAHISAINHSKQSENAVLHYYVGPSPYHKQGILLLNPKTRQTIVRRSYQQLKFLMMPSPISLSKREQK